MMLHMTTSNTIPAALVALDTCDNCGGYAEGNTCCPPARATGPITDDHIRDLRIEAAMAGDYLTAAMCCKALGDESNLTLTPKDAEELADLDAAGCRSQCEEIITTTRNESESE